MNRIDRIAICPNGRVVNERRGFCSRGTGLCPEPNGIFMSETEFDS